jgi:hypothetical protein
VVLNAEAISHDQELVEDPMTVTNGSSSGWYGVRNYREAVQTAAENDQSP